MTTGMTTGTITERHRNRTPVYGLELPGAGATWSVVGGPLAPVLLPLSELDEVSGTGVATMPPDGPFTTAL